MSNKAFEAGMVAGAKPLEEKFQKQANAFDRTADRLGGKLDDIKEVTDTLADDGLARERKEVFGLNTLFDINSMEDTEKILVVSLLYTLAQRFEANGYQKNYIRSVQKYLGLKNIQPADTLTGVEGVKNFDDQKAILQVVMEYLFLECFSFDFLDEEDYEELFNSFNINRKGFREVETAIENLRRARSVAEKQPADYKAQNGDTAVIDFTGYIDDKEFEGGAAKMHHLVLGSGAFIPGFEDQIIGHKSGDEFDVNVKFPKDYHADNLAGKPARFAIKLHEVRKHILPELNDDFAKEIGQESVEKLREHIRNILNEQYENAAQSEMRNELLDALADKVKLDLPEILVDQEGFAYTATTIYDYKFRSVGINTSF